MKKFKKLICLILTLCLILAPLGLGLTVFADDGDSEESPEVFEQDGIEDSDDESESEKFYPDEEETEENVEELNENINGNEEINENAIIFDNNINENELDPEIYDIEAIESGLYDSESREQLAQEYEPNVLLVKFYPKSNFPGKEKQYDDAVGQVTKWGFDYIEALGVYVVYIEELEKNPNAVLNRFKNNRFIEYVEPNYLGSFELAPKDATYGTIGARYAQYINAEAGWDIITDSNVLVAVVDTGYSGNNDLPPASGYSVFNKNYDLTDVNGHGTQVAGTFGAIGNNGIGNTGVVWNANIMPVKVSETASVTLANVASGITYAADNGAKIINLSIGFISDSATLKNAVDYAYNKGCVIVAATGNHAREIVCFPAAYINVLGVGGTSNGTDRTANSNYGSGLDILASWNWYSTNNLNGNMLSSGTSFASPQVAGLAALVWELAPRLTNLEVMDLIRKNTNRPGGAWNNETGWGIIDMGKTLKAAQALAGSSTPPATAPQPAPAPAAPAPTEPPKPVYASPPKITLKGFAEISIETGDVYSEDGYTATDSLGVNITANVKVSSNLNNAVPGRYTITYTVTDAGSNTTSVTRTVIVTQKVVQPPEPVIKPPTLTIIGSNPIILYVSSRGGTPYFEQGAIAIDEIDGNISNLVQITGIVDTSKAGTYTVTYKVKNSAGLEAAATRNVRILAPTETITRTPYTFSGQAKQGDTVTHKGIVAAEYGTMELNLSALDKNMTITVTLVDTRTNKAVVTDTFSATGKKNYTIDDGNYELRVKIDKASGNSKYTIGLLMPTVTFFTFAENEIPMFVTLFGDDADAPRVYDNPPTGDGAAIYAVFALMALGALAIAAKRRRVR